MTKLETPQKENKRIYYFSTHSYQVAFEVLNIEPHQVYKTDEKGLFYLLKSIIDCADDFVDSEDGCFIPIELDTNLDKVIKETREMAGYDYPEEFRPPKEEEKKQTNGVVEFKNDPKPISIPDEEIDEILKEGDK